MIGKMFVIDGVEQGLFDDIGQIGYLENKNAVVRQQGLDPVNDATQVIGVGEDVVGGDDGGGAVAFKNFRRHRRGEKPDRGLDSGVACRSAASSRFWPFSLLSS